MRKRFLAWAIAASLTPLAANASNGTLTFGGELTNETCTITAPANFTVTLPAVPTSSFANLYDKAGETQFSIFITNCTAGVNGANVFFEDGSTVLSFDDTLKNTAASGAATNVELILRTTDGGAIDLVSDGGVQYTQFANNVSSGVGSPKAARLDFRVAYMATGVVTPGIVQSSITYSMVYN
jgi:major type 1 subunit fimbrin (pilin)